MKAPMVSESISNSPTIVPASRIRTTSSVRVWIEQARYSSRPRAHPRRSGYAHLRPPRRRRPPRLTVSPRLQSTEEGRGAARDPGLFNRTHRSAWKGVFCEVRASNSPAEQPTAFRLATGEQLLFQGLCQPGFVLIPGPARLLHQLPVDFRLSEGQQDRCGPARVQVGAQGVLHLPDEPVHDPSPAGLCLPHFRGSLKVHCRRALVDGYHAAPKLPLAAALVRDHLQPALGITLLPSLLVDLSRARLVKQDRP